MIDHIIDIFLSVLKCKFIDAHKRNLSRQFIFGSSELIEKRKDRLLPENGDRAAFGAVKLGNAKAPRLLRSWKVDAEALTRREAVSGRVATVIRNNLKALGADHWALAFLSKNPGFSSKQTKKRLSRIVYSRHVSYLPPQGHCSQALLKHARRSKALLNRLQWKNTQPSCRLVLS